ncbi:WW domain-containing protein [Pycnococcus provasolii]
MSSSSSALPLPLPLKASYRASAERKRLVQQGVKVKTPAELKARETSNQDRENEHGGAESIQQTVLPEGWVAYFDDTYAREFYYNTTTGESSWVPPEGTKIVTTTQKNSAEDSDNNMYADDSFATDPEEAGVDDDDSDTDENEEDDDDDEDDELKSSDDDDDDEDEDGEEEEEEEDNTGGEKQLKNKERSALSPTNKSSADLDELEAQLAALAAENAQDQTEFNIDAIEQGAATLIQSHVRGSMARKETSRRRQHKRENEAAVRIQASFRGSNVRRGLVKQAPPPPPPPDVPSPAGPPPPQPPLSADLPRPPAAPAAVSAALSMHLPAATAQPALPRELSFTAMRPAPINIRPAHAASQATAAQASMAMRSTVLEDKIVSHLQAGRYHKLPSCLTQASAIGWPANNTLVVSSEKSLELLAIAGRFRRACRKHATARMRELFEEAEALEVGRSKSPVQMARSKAKQALAALDVFAIAREAAHRENVQELKAAKERATIKGYTLVAEYADGVLKHIQGQRHVRQWLKQKEKESRDKAKSDKRAARAERPIAVVNRLQEREAQNASAFRRWKKVKRKEARANAKNEITPTALSEQVRASVAAGTSVLNNWQMKSLLHREMQARARNDNEFKKWKARKDAQEAMERLQAQKAKMQENRGTTGAMRATHEAVRAAYMLRRPLFEV